VSVIPFALIGVLLSRRHGWRIALMVPLLIATWLVIVYNTAGLVFPAPSRINQYWRDILLVTMVATVWLLGDAIWRRAGRRSAWR
jgi:hypothetical protein